MKISLPPQTLMLPSPVLIVGTYGPDGKPNIMNAAWGGIACSKPPCISISLREATLTYHNIKATEAFTVNFTSERFIKEADYVGMFSGKDCDKFKETGLTPVKSKLVNAPIVLEFPYALECKLVKQVELGSHTLFVGEIVGIEADDDMLNEKNVPTIDKVRPVMWGSFSSMAYYGVGENLGRSFSIGNEMKKKD